MDPLDHHHRLHTYGTRTFSPGSPPHTSFRLVPLQPNTVLRIIQKTGPTRARLEKATGRSPQQRASVLAALRLAESGRPPSDLHFLTAARRRY